MTLRPPGATVRSGLGGRLSERADPTPVDGQRGGGDLLLPRLGRDGDPGPDLAVDLEDDR